MAGGRTTDATDRQATQGGKARHPDLWNGVGVRLLGMLRSLVNEHGEEAVFSASLEVLKYPASLITHESEINRVARTLQCTR